MFALGGRVHLGCVCVRDGRWSLGSLEESLSANLADNVTSLLVLCVRINWSAHEASSQGLRKGTYGLELRLGSLAFLLVALTLLLCLGSLVSNK